MLRKRGVYIINSTLKQNVSCHAVGSANTGCSTACHCPDLAALYRARRSCFCSTLNLFCREIERIACCTRGGSLVRTTCYQCRRCIRIVTDKPAACDIPLCRYQREYMRRVASRCSSNTLVAFAQLYLAMVIPTGSRTNSCIRIDTISSVCTLYIKLGIGNSCFLIVYIHAIRGRSLWLNRKVTSVNRCRTTGIHTIRSRCSC